MTIAAEYKNLHGATIAFGTSTTVAMTIISFTEADRAADEIDDQDLASSVKKSFASAVIDEGTLSLVCRYLPGTTDPVTLVGGLDEQITITYPLRTGEATAAKKVFTGHVTKASGIKGGNTDRCERSVDIKVNSTIAFTPAA